MSIKKKISQLIKKNKKFLIGFSGGIDSTVLLYELYKQSLKKKIHIRAIYINHNINTLSTIWSKHCKKICKKLNIKLIIKKINKKFKKNILSSLRKERYKIYKKCLLKKEIILTAHHKNDQCETFFLSLKRGSGPKGLSGIKKKIKLNNKIIIYRPLLKISKKKIKKYALENKLSWIEDDNNKNINLDRNFLRLIIIKKLIKRWPYFLSSVYRSSKICFKQEELLYKFLKKKIKKNITSKNYLNIKNLLKYKKIEKFLITRKWIELNKKQMISYHLINEMWKKIDILKKKTYFTLYFKKFLIHKYKNFLYLTKKYKNKITKLLIWKNTDKNFYLPNKNGYLYIKKNKFHKNNKNLVRKNNINESIYIKFGIKNKIKIKGKKKQKIKKIWQKNKIFPWKRNIMPIIFYNENPILCPNIFKTENGEPQEKKSWIIKWKK